MTRYGIVPSGSDRFAVIDHADYNAIAFRADDRKTAEDWIEGRAQLAGLGRVYRVARRFYDDHVERALPGGRLLRATKLIVTVELDGEEYLELLSDARYYATEMTGAGYGDSGMVASAGSVVRALEKAGAPTEPLLVHKSTSANLDFYRGTDSTVEVCCNALEKVDGTWRAREIPTYSVTVHKTGHGITDEFRYEPTVRPDPVAPLPAHVVAALVRGRS